MLQILLPAWTVCLDLFFTAIAYGISGIRIPVRAACILSGTGAGCFLAAMELAKWSGLFLPASFCKLAGVVLLAAMGGAMLLKSFVEPADSSEKSANFRTVYFDAACADADHSRSLSARESFLLAAALSVDSLAVGVGIGWQDSMPVAIAGATLLFGILGVLCGTKSVFGYIVGKNGIIAGSAERVCCCSQCCKQCNNIVSRETSHYMT
ncbi:MAG: manganese efflux pump [Ruminococcus sp.]